MDNPISGFILRPAANKDVPAIQNLIFTVLREYGLPPDEHGKDKDLHDVEAHYFSRNGYFGVAVDTNTGEIAGTFGLSPLGPESCELRKMYLYPHARGKGLGKKMLQTAIETARQKGYKKMVLETISPLKEAIALYRKAGFREVAPLEVNDRVDQAFELELD